MNTVVRIKKRHALVGLMVPLLASCLDSLLMQKL